MFMAAGPLYFKRPGCVFPRMQATQAPPSLPGISIVQTGERQQSGHKKIRETLPRERFPHVLRNGLYRLVHWRYFNAARAEA